MSPRFSDPPQVRAVAHPCGHEIDELEATGITEPFAIDAYSDGRVVTEVDLIARPCGHLVEAVTVTPLGGGS